MLVYSLVGISFDFELIFSNLKSQFLGTPFVTSTENRTILWVVKGFIFFVAQYFNRIVQFLFLFFEILILSTKKKNNYFYIFSFKVKITFVSIHQK